MSTTNTHSNLFKHPGHLYKRWLWKMIGLDKCNRVTESAKKASNGKPFYHNIGEIITTVNVISDVLMSCSF